MKVSDIKKTQRQLDEAPAVSEDSDIKLPLGVDPKDYDDDFKDMLRYYRKVDPKLYQKMLNGD